MPVTVHTCREHGLFVYSADPQYRAQSNTQMDGVFRANFVSRLLIGGHDFGEHTGPLSIKCARRGEELYEVGRGRHRVDSSSYLILNEGQTYRSKVEYGQQIESFCIWFQSGFAERAHAALHRSHQHLLDDPGLKSSSVTFFERNHLHDRSVSPVLDAIHEAVTQGHAESAWLEERFHQLIARMLEVHRGIYREVERVPALRASTREELYRRLYRARDFIEASLTLPTSLNDAAAAADLAPHHFLRSFKQLFGETPCRYQTRRRMEKARELVLKSDLAITEICYEVGFESPGSFSWDFRRRYGLSPAQLRAGAGRSLPA